jgi:hypothetical protein
LRRAISIGLVATALLGACERPSWAKGELEEAYRLCRAEAGFPPISVFEESGASGFNTFMCTCEVAFLAERIPYHHFRDGKHVPQVNNALGTARTSCLYRFRNGER